MLAVDPVALEGEKAGRGRLDKGQRLGPQGLDREDQVHRIASRLQQAVDPGDNVRGRDRLHAGSVPKVAVPIAAEAGKGLDNGDGLSGRESKTRPVAAAKDPDHGPAHCGRQMHGSRVMPHVEFSLPEERGQQGQPAVLAEPNLWTATAMACDPLGDRFQGLRLGFVRHEQHRDFLISLDMGDEFGKALSGP